MIFSAVVRSQGRGCRCYLSRWSLGGFLATCTSYTSTALGYRGIRRAIHLHTKQMFASLEVLVVISPDLRACRDPYESPTVELSSKTRELGLLEIAHEHFVGESSLL